jgi:hypothetical protein
MPTIPLRGLKLTDVTGVQSDSGPGCHGFSIGPQQGTPWINIVYRTQIEAEAARKAVAEALRDAVEVVKPDNP